MSEFQTLFRTLRRMVGDRLAPDTRSQLFPDVVRKSKRLDLWNAGDPIPENGHRLLIGVATWSAPDMLLLDLIDEARETDLLVPMHVDVLDLAECKNSDDIERVIPGIGKTSHSPVVGLWKNGEIIRRAAGNTARQLIELWFGLGFRLHEQMGSLSKAS